MLSEPTLRGYLLEEALAWLLRNSGYRLLGKDDQDRDLITTGNTLRVQGRGAQHQVDVLGQFVLTPAFSLPIRMFIEAKFRRPKCALRTFVMRTESFMTSTRTSFRSGDHDRGVEIYTHIHYSPPAASRRKRKNTHWLSRFRWVNLSGASFAGLREAVRVAAMRLRRSGIRHRVRAFPVDGLRQRLRARLGTPIAPQEASYKLDDTNFNVLNESDVEQTIGSLVESLRGRGAMAELLLGFPAAPFILALHADDPRDFIQYAERHPAHHVHLGRTSTGKQAEWSVSPQADSGAYRLAFDLPDRVEAWIDDSDRDRTQYVKMQLLPQITIYRQDNHHTKVYQLLYQPGQLNRQSR